MNKPTTLTPRTTLRRLAAATALALASLAGTPAAAQPLPDPRVPWFTADSANFRVHYREGQRAQAEAVARAAERVYPRVTQALNWVPRTRTEIIVFSEIGVANGYTTPLPFNMMGIFLTPPDEGQLLDNSAWLDLLLVHEFTHAVHLDKLRGAPRVLQSIFGNLPWFIPNLFNPGWVVEGLAVWMESDPPAGRGRLQGPMFEAWLRAERARGFLSLRELNADGRALPLSKQYLYGAYFFEFLARRYGADKPRQLVEQYSGNIVPRLHSLPWEATGKPMDALWTEFLADLAQQVDQRAAPLKAQAETLGAPIGEVAFDWPAVVALPDGALLAVADDGLNGTLLQRLETNGQRRTLTRVNDGARLSVAPDGRVLVMQPDLCNTLYYAYDAYALEGSTLKPLSHCAHLRRAVYAGNDLLALQLHEGTTRLVRLGPNDGAPTVLFSAEPGSDLIDLAASADGRSVAFIGRQAGRWQLQRLDLGTPGAKPEVLLTRDAPMHSLRQGAAGLELVAAVNGVYNVWRLQGGQLQRLTHTHTAVVTHSGTAADGTLASVVVAPQGYRLHRGPVGAPLQTLDVAAPATPAPATATANPVTAAAPVLGEASGYAAWRSIYPRSWMPLITADRGLMAYGASTSGGDALGWHRYAASLAWETSQREALGLVEYSFAGSHSLAVARSLSAVAWNPVAGEDITTVYDRRTQAQWLSFLPFSRVERRVRLGVGAGLDRIDRVTVATDGAQRRRDNKVAALLLDVDTRGEAWFSEGPNRGWRASLLVESYKPFDRGGNGAAADYSGGVLRADLLGHVQLPGRSNLALRWTEVKASGSTAAFQLGGATDEVLQFGPQLNHRELALRGYEGNEAVLRGANARVVSAEWRTPLWDVDRHFMVPAVGLNRLSATVFADVGGAWQNGASGPDRWRTGVGVEVLAELKLLYALGLQLRLGVARGLDEPKATQGYLTLGRGF